MSRRKWPSWSGAGRAGAHLTEQTVLFASVFKWIVLATAIGTIVGLASAGFLGLLDLSSRSAHRFSYHYLFLPVALGFSSWLVLALAPEAAGHGTEKVIEAIHRRSGRIAPAVTPVKLLATLATLSAGGSAGKEGPCAQIGGSLASTLATLLRFEDRDRKKLVICGISAGFAAVFGTPLAGALFGVEVLFVGGILYDVLLPSFVAGLIGFHVASRLGVVYFHSPVAFAPVFSEVFLLKVALAGVLFGLTSFAFIEILGGVSKLARRIRVWPPLKAVLGGSALVLLTLVFGTRYLGMGLSTIAFTLGGQAPALPWYAFLLKEVFTAITLAFGGSGGIITPIFFVGTSAGTAFSHVLGIDPATCAAIGLVALLAGCANTPISASILAVELFGTAIAPYAAMACIISFLITGHRSVYPTQILSVAKSDSLKVEIGSEIEHANTAFEVPGSLVGWRARWRRTPSNPAEAAGEEE